MFYLSRHLLQKHSAFLTKLTVISLLCATCVYTQGIQAADQKSPDLHIFTEVRDGSELLVDAQGRTSVDNTMSRLVEAVLNETDLIYTSTVVPWSRMMSNLQTRPNTLAYPVMRIPEREELFLWAGQIRTIDAYLLGLTSRSSELPHTLEEARNFRIGSMRGDAFHNYFRALEYPNLVIVGNNTPWLSMLERDRIDLMPFSLTGIELFLQRHDAPPDMLEPLIRLDELSHPLYFVMNLDSDPKLVEQITQAYRRVVQNGDFERIMGFSPPGL